MKKVPFFIRSFAENVAYNTNSGDPIEAAVSGWIKSESHMKNLLSNSNICAIAVFKFYNRYFFT
jgi:uncharacterized protein YkwD